MSEKEGVLRVAEYFNGLTLYSPEAQIMPAAMSHVRVTLPMALAMQECIRSMANCLAALEARAETGVTEAMVERAREAYRNAWWVEDGNADGNPFTMDARNRIWRAALEAAFNGGARDGE